MTEQRGDSVTRLRMVGSDAAETREAGGSYAVVEDVAASWENYERVAAALAGPPPRGLILHAAGPTDEGFRIIEVWESEEAWACFRAHRPSPTDGVESLHRQPVLRALRPANLVMAEKPSARWD